MRYCSNKPIEEIPHTDSKYTIDRLGFVNGQRKCHNEPIELTIFGSTYRVSLAWLMAFSFKPIFNAEEFTLSWKVLFVDDNPSNTSPENLIWQPPKGGQPCPEKESYFVIPGHSFFAMTKQGEIFNRRFPDSIPTGRISKEGYLCYHLTRDNGSHTSAAVNRLLCLTFMEYNKDVWKLTSNHIDGIKTNNGLDNLEWATYGYNNVHAMDIGLRTTRMKTFVKDHRTGQVMEFKSSMHAADYCKCNSGVVHRYLKEKSKLVNFRYSFSFVDEGWPEYNPEELRYLEESSVEWKATRACCAFDVITKKSVVASNPSSLGKLLGLDDDVIRTAIESPYAWPSSNYIMFFMNNPKPIRNFSKEELEAFEGRRGIIRPVSVTYRDGTKKVYISPLEFSKLNGLTPRLTADKLYQGKGVWITEDFTVCYIDRMLVDTEICPAE